MEGSQQWISRGGEVDGVSKGKGRTSKMELIGGGIQEVAI